MSDLKEAGITIIDPEAVDKLLAAKPQGAEVELHAQAGMLGGIAGIEPMGIPIGGAAIGVAVSSLVSALVARFAPGQTALLAGPMGKLGLAWAIKQYLSKPLGAKNADAVAFVLTVSAIEGWVKQMIGQLTGMTLGQTMRGTVATQGDGHREITSIEEYNLVHGL